MAQYVGLFPSLARTATANSALIASDERAVGLVVTIVATAAVSSPSVVFTIQSYDPASATYATLLASSAITGAGSTVLRVHPDLTASANAVAKDMLPRFWRVLATAANGNSLTYSVSASMV